MELVGASSVFASWAGHFHKIVLGRPNWSAQEEFAFYCVTPELVRLHRERQVAFAREAYASGLSIMRAMDILDTEWLRDRVILDIGAGECVLSQAIAGPGRAKEVWALEATPKQIWAAAERHTASNLHCVIGDAQALPFNDASFDVVVANLVLHHIHPLDKLLSEVARVLRGGGLFVAFEPNPVTGSITHQQTSANEAPIAPSTIASSLRRAGLVDVASSYWWIRGATSALGLLSPGFRIRALKPGDTPRAQRPLPRDLPNVGLPGLRYDDQCSFAELATEQAKAIAALNRGETEARSGH